MVNKNKKNNITYRFFLLIIILAALICTLILTIKNQNVYYLISFILCAIIFIYSIYDTGSEIKKIDKEEEKKYFDELSLKYAELIKLIEVKSNSHIRELKQQDIDYALLTYKTNLNWLINYDQYLDNIKENRIKGNPDTFIEAACLIKALTESFYITIDSDNSIEDYQIQLIYHKIEFMINIDIALKAAFEIISNPIVYVKNPERNWVLVKQEVKDIPISIPDGIIEKNPLHNRIINSFYKDYINGESISIMQLSNMLHLLYLYCRDTKKQIK